MVRNPGYSAGILATAVKPRPNSALKLTVRHRFSRRPSRLPRLEFARRRATCTGIIGLRRKRRAARRRPPSGGPQFNVKTLGRLQLYVPLQPHAPAILVLVFAPPRRSCFEGLRAK